LRQAALLVLSKIAKSLSFFSVLPNHIPDSIIIEQCQRIFSTLALVNIAQTQKKYNIPDSDTNE